MSEQNQNGVAAEQEQGSQFSLQRIYIKDLSFEVPKSPEVFRKEWAPKIEMQLSTGHSHLEGDFYEVGLGITVTARIEDEVAFIAEVEQAGIFLIQGLDEASLGHALGSFAPSLLFPYARETLDGMVVKGSFPALMLAPVNFDAIYAQELQRRQAAATDNSGQE
ncbi:protein-export chaperone SecB [Thiopseudomonas denitrificans]|uniref:Protein-export protein SecB n=1 Tax=Thiopseudomonas denitrificans TaxID=1501432 RepID=A0A4R6U1W5_9GAMM|nr:protein-export chaperone SecB [Thiopseudomonas denitrificans]TDQ37084.1 protein translocase subunit secB [Thiopseudomonas denitrificans]